MKRLLVLLVCLTIVVCLYSAELTTEQAKIYNSKALSVSERMETRGSSSASAWRVSRNSAIAFGSSQATSMIKWDAYQGGNRISKAEFFRIAGYPEYEKLCLDIETANQERKSKGQTLTIVGGIVYGAGIIVMLLPIMNDSRDLTPLYIGGVIGCVGAIPLAIGIDMMLTTEEPDISASFAFGVADIFNQELKANITLNY